MHYTIYVRPIDSGNSDSTFTGIVSSFTQNYIKTEATTGIINKLDDIGITFEIKGENEMIKLEFGPYRGVGDLNKRNFLIASKEMLDKCITMGQMCIVTITEPLVKSKGLSFGSYKVLHTISTNHIQHLWK